MKQISIELSDDLKQIGVRRLLLRQHHLARYIKLKLSQHGDVIIVYPKRHPRPNWKKLIASQWHWLKREINKLNLPPENPLPPNSIHLPATGESFNISYQSPVNAAKYRKNESRIQIQHQNIDDWQPVLKRWFIAQAKQDLVPWLIEVSNRVDLPLRKVSIRNQRSRWGSCNQHNDISLNAKLLLLEPEIVEYLFIHELCHTAHMNHSRAYWAFVESLLPDWREHDRQLQQAMAKLPHWLID